MRLVKTGLYTAGTLEQDSKQSEIITSFRPSFLLRHVTAFVLFWFCWQALTRWYLYQQNIDFASIFVLLAAAVGVGWRAELISILKQAPKSRTALVFFILILSIPWGEFLRLNFASARMDWTRQLFYQSVCVYSLLLFFRVFPQFANKLSDTSRRVLDKLSARREALWFPPVMLFILSCSIMVFVYHRTPVVNDSSSYLFQAKIFTHGNLYAPIPKLADFFSYEIDMLLMKDGKWFSMYPPGYPLLLALAMLIHAQWFLSPVLGACTLAIWIEYARRWHNRPVALLTGLLGVFSPFLFQMFSTILVHAPELFIASSILYLCRRQTEQTSKLRNLILFLLLGTGMLVRAFSLLLFLGPVIALTCWKSLKTRSISVPVAIAGGIFVGMLLLGLYQWKTVGNPWTAAYSLEYTGLKYGFGKNYAGQIHTPLRGLELVSNSILGLNYWLNGWYSGSLFFICAFFLLEPRLHEWDRILLASSLTLILFYFAYFFQDLIFGPRFLFLLAPFLLFLIARSTGIGTGNSTGKKTHIAIRALLVISFLSFFPARFLQFVRIYNPANDPPEYLNSKVWELGHLKVLLFLDKQISQDYVNCNDPYLRSPLIICRDLGGRNQEVVSAFTGFEPYYFRFKNLSFHSTDQEDNYGFYRNRLVTGPILSFFQLALTLQA
jgi:hypothetical protein